GNKRPGTARRGFTLLEILLVIGLIAIASSVVIVNFVAFTDRGDSTAPEEVLTQAIRKARFVAAADRITTRLRYDDESGHLRIDPTDERFEINSDFGREGRGEIRFFLIPPAEGLGPFPDPERSTLETPAVAFAPDRSSSPFIAEIDSGRGTPTRLRFDPFSSVIRTDE
ncbi:MAG: type II secretion system protein, partial [Opitutales bacterium]